MYCTNCHMALQPGVTACPACGTPVSDNPAQAGSPSYEPHSSASVTQDTYGYTIVPPPNAGYAQEQPQAGYISGPTPGVSDNHEVVPVQPPKRRRRVGLIIGLVAGCVLLLCVGFVTFAVVSSRSGVSNLTNTPSGRNIVSSASTILHNPHTSTEIDQEYNPTHVTSTFKTHQLVYLTFDIDSGDKDGYIQAKWYANGQIVNISVFSHAHANNAGLFTLAYTIPTTSGAVELYWCTHADCSDAQLAQVLHFTITNTSFAPENPTDAHKGLPYYIRRV